MSNFLTLESSYGKLDIVIKLIHVGKFDYNDKNVTCCCGVFVGNTGIFNEKRRFFNRCQTKGKP